CRCSVFFFSSRRRHTSFSRDWSSDVCSSDLIARYVVSAIVERPKILEREEVRANVLGHLQQARNLRHGVTRREHAEVDYRMLHRSEERSVGKEGRSRWAA